MDPNLVVLSHPLFWKSSKRNGWLSLFFLFHVVNLCNIFLPSRCLSSVLFLPSAVIVCFELPRDFEEGGGGGVDVCNRGRASFTQRIEGFPGSPTGNGWEEEGGGGGGGEKA